MISKYKNRSRITFLLIEVITGTGLFFFIGINYTSVVVFSVLATLYLAILREMNCETTKQSLTNVIIMLVAFLIITSTAYRTARREVAETVNEFLLLWRSQDYKTAYSYMSRFYRSKNSLSEFEYGIMEDFAQSSNFDSSTWRVDPNINVELNGRKYAYVSEYGSKIFGMRFVDGICYELRNDVGKWKFTGNVVIRVD